MENISSNQQTNRTHSKNPDADPKLLTNEQIKFIEDTKIQGPGYATTLYNSKFSTRISRNEYIVMSMNLPVRKDSSELLQENTFTTNTHQKQMSRFGKKHIDGSTLSSEEQKFIKTNSYLGPGYAASKFNSKFGSSLSRQSYMNIAYGCPELKK